MRDVGEQKAPEVLGLGATEEELDEAHLSWKNFDAASCNCFDQHDRDRILKVISNSDGGISHFNLRVRQIAACVWENDADKMGTICSVVNPSVPTFCNESSD